MEAAGLRASFSHVSSGGGGALELLRDGTLPGLEALDDISDGAVPSTALKQSPSSFLGEVVKEVGSAPKTILQR